MIDWPAGDFIRRSVLASFVTFDAGERGVAGSLFDRSLRPERGKICKVLADRHKNGAATVFFCLCYEEKEAKIESLAHFEPR